MLWIVQHSSGTKGNGATHSRCDECQTTCAVNKSYFVYTRMQIFTRRNYSHCKLHQIADYVEWYSTQFLVAEHLMKSSFSACCVRLASAHKRTINENPWIRYAVAALVIIGTAGLSGCWGIKCILSHALIMWVIFVGKSNRFRARDTYFCVLNIKTLALAVLIDH